MSAHRTATNRNLSLHATIVHLINTRYGGSRVPSRSELRIRIRNLTRTHWEQFSRDGN